MYSYQPHRITRSRVVVGLMVTAMLASCAAPAANRGSTPLSTASATADAGLPAPVSPTTMAQTKANVAAGSAKSGQEEIRFTDVASCKAETKQLNAEYKILKDSFDAGTLTGSAPIKPTLQPDECEAFIASAKQQYAAKAPTYTNQNNCEASERSCERIEPSPSNNYIEPVYRPVFFGSYGYNPWAPPIYIGGRRDYGQQTVIIERDNGNRASSAAGGGGSDGRTSGSNTSRNNTSRGTSNNTSQPTTSKTTSKTTQPSSSRVTPSKPSSTSGSGAISGRGSSGFGSSYGYSGKGGK